MVLTCPHCGRTWLTTTPYRLWCQICDVRYLVRTETVGLVSRVLLVNLDALESKYASDKDKLKGASMLQGEFEIEYDTQPQAPSWERFIEDFGGDPDFWDCPY